VSVCPSVRKINERGDECRPHLVNMANCLNFGVDSITDMDSESLFREIGYFMTFSSIFRSCGGHVCVSEIFLCLV